MVWLSLCLVTLSSTAACLGDAKATRVFSIAVVPQLAPVLTYARWAPILEHIGRRTGQCFELEVPHTIPAFEKLLFMGKPDFAFANPYHEVMARRRQGYVPLLMDGRERLSGILTVQADSPIRDVRELHGKEVAFPAPNAFAASLLIRAQLARQGIRIQPVYLRTHAQVYRAVAQGDKPAGGGVNNTLQREDEALRNSLRVLYETPQFAPHPLIAHPRIPLAAREALVSTFVSLAASEAGQALLDAVQIPVPTRADYRRDYAPLESLGLERFVVLDAD